MISFKTSIQYLPYIKDILAQFSKGVLAKMAESLDTLEDLHELLESSIEEEYRFRSRKVELSKKVLMKKSTI